MNFSSWEWAAFAAMGMAGLVVLVRLLRKGLSTYTGSRRAMGQRIAQTQAEMRERTHAISKNEQMYILTAAIEELLHLAGQPEGFACQSTPHGVCMHTPQGVYEVSFTGREAALKSQKRTLYGTGQWKVLGPQQDVQYFSDLAPLVRWLDGRVRPHRYEHKTGVLQ